MVAKSRVAQSRAAERGVKKHCAGGAEEDRGVKAVHRQGQSSSEARTV